MCTITDSVDLGTEIQPSETKRQRGRKTPREGAKLREKARKRDRERRTHLCKPSVGVMARFSWDFYFSRLTPSIGASSSFEWAEHQFCCLAIWQTILKSECAFDVSSSLPWFSSSLTWMEMLLWKRKERANCWGWSVVGAICSITHTNSVT